MISGQSFRLLGQFLLCLISTIIIPAWAAQDSARQEPAKPAINNPLASEQSAILPAKQFKYPIRLGYRAAQSAKDTVSKLFCYCGCDSDQNHHTTLHDCFTSIHGAYCPICQEEAIMAAALKTKGATLARIQSDIDCNFAKRYPYKSPSKTLSTYRHALSAQGVLLGKLPALSEAASNAKNKANHPCCAK